MNFIHSGYHNQRFDEHQRVNLDFVQRYWKYTPDDYDVRGKTFADITFRMIETDEQWRFETKEQRDEVFEKIEKICATRNLSENISL